MVAAIDVQTTGLGGDSEVQITPETGVTVGPRRMVPLSLLGSTYPEVLTVLRDSLGRGQPNETSGGFVLRRRGGTAATLDPYAAEVWAQLGETPLPLEALLGGRSRAFARRHGLASLLKLGWVSLAGFTPSDAAHILGRQATWSLEAARLGAEVWTRRARQLLRQPELTPDGFCTLVMEATMLQLGRAVARAALGADVPEATGPSGDWVRRFLDRALAADGAGDPADLLEVSLHLRRPLAAIGAPVATYFPEVARRLGTRLVIPPYAEVANAVGAVVGSVAQTVTLRIQPLDAGASYRVHLPEGIADFPTLNAAAAHAEEVAAAAARALAGRAGAPAPQVTVTRIDHIFYPPDGGRAEIYLDSEVSATAIGRPGF
jgi:N-methylhydantoinase A/oxoprolinase/acetone carboxylase beta subunit